VTLLEQMLAACRRGRCVLDSQASLVLGFFLDHTDASGGFHDRAGRPDLYYTVFGLGALRAFDARMPDSTPGWLEQFGDGEGLDLVHLSCLARCRALLGDGQDVLPGIAQRVEACRADDEGYAPEPGGAGTAYGTFLALNALEDAGGNPPGADRLGPFLETLKAPDGGYANEPGEDTGITPISAGIAVLRRQLDLPEDPNLRPWLLARLHPDGGFTATPDVPIADLLTTATVLQAIGPADGEPWVEPTRSFVQSLFDAARGGFRGHAVDDQADIEYTWYGLMSLGNLEAAP
jgi:prenyltransferase beta subunit